MVPLIIAAIILFLPLDASCQNSDQNVVQQIATEIVANFAEENVNGIAQKFDQLETIFSHTDYPQEEAMHFLESFVSGINVRYGTSLTALQVCEYVRDNIHNFQMPDDDKTRLLILLDMLLIEGRASLYWPWEWNWFGYNKKEKTKDMKERKAIQPNPISISIDPPVLDGNVIEPIQVKSFGRFFGSFEPIFDSNRGGNIDSCI